MQGKTQQMMDAVEIKASGPTGELAPTQRPMPKPGDDEVLIRVRAAGVNRPDILQRLGKYPPPLGITDIPGLEVAGEIVESKSKQWKEGDQVCALLAGGGYAQYAAAPAGQCLPLPEGLGMTEAAALPEAVFTVWNNLFVRGGLKAGQSVLIHGGSSGIGTTAIQMAVAAGATVLVTAGTAEKCAACLSLGAAMAVNYKDQDFVAAVMAHTEERGVDIVLDMVGGDYVPRNLAVLAPDGRHVSIATLNGATASVDLRTVMQKRLILTGSTLRNRPVEEKAALAHQIAQFVWPWVKLGMVRPVIHDTLPLAMAGTSHKTLENGAHIGKIVLLVP